MKGRTLPNNPVTESLVTFATQAVRPVVRQVEGGTSCELWSPVFPERDMYCRQMEAVQHEVLVAQGFARLNPADVPNNTVGALIAQANAYRQLADRMEETGRLLDLIREGA